MTERRSTVLRQTDMLEADRESYDAGYRAGVEAATAVAEREWARHEAAAAEHGRATHWGQVSEERALAVAQLADELRALLGRAGDPSD